MILAALPNLSHDQAAFQLDTGEFVVVEVVAETVEQGGYILRMRGWRANEDGTRWTNSRGSVAMIPSKFRRITDPEVDLDNEKADAIATVAKRVGDHIVALKAVRPDPEEDTDKTL